MAAPRIRRMSTSPRKTRPWRALRLALPLLLLCGLPQAAAAQAVRHELDPVHTRVLFAVSHAGLSDALGTVSGSTGELWFDPDDWRSARLSASVPMARLDLGDAEWNRAALASNLLDAGDHPAATFVSTRVEPVDDNHARVHGILGLRGVEREVVLEVALNAAKRHPMPPFRRTLGFSATTTISRKAFGMDAWPTVIGDEIEIRIEAEAIRRRDDRQAGEDPAPAPDSAEAAAQPAAGSSLPVGTTGEDAGAAPAIRPAPESPPAEEPDPENKPEPATEPDATP